MNQSIELLNNHFDGIEKEIGTSKEAAQKAMSTAQEGEAQPVGPNVKQEGKTEPTKAQEKKEEQKPSASQQELHRFRFF